MSDRPTKGRNGWTFIRHDRLSYTDKDRRGNNSSQVLACVANISKAALSRKLGERSTSFVNNYWSDTINDEMADALAAYPPGTILVKGEYGQLIDGQDGWVPL